jgi:hypothetical protein
MRILRSERHEEIPKFRWCDGSDGHDDEMQRFSKGDGRSVRRLERGVGREATSISPTMRDVGLNTEVLFKQSCLFVKLPVPFSSERTVPLRVSLFQATELPLRPTAIRRTSTDEVVHSPQHVG